MIKDVLSVMVALCGFCVALAHEKPVVSVGEFTANSDCQVSEGDIQRLRQRIEGQISGSTKYTLVERKRLFELAEEFKLGDAGVTAGATPESNKLKSAFYHVYGDVLQFRSYEQTADIGDIAVVKLNGIVEIQLSIARVETGEKRVYTIKSIVSKRKTTTVRSNVDLKLEAMTDAVADAAKKVVGKLNEMAFPVYVGDVDTDELMITGNISEDQVNAGDKWRVYKRGKKIMNPDTGVWEGSYREKRICEVTVAIPGPRATKFKVAKQADAQKIEEMLDNDVVLLIKRDDDLNRTHPQPPPEGMGLMPMH